MTNFSVNIIGKEAHLTWTPVADLDLSHYIIRHSTATSGAAFNTSRTLVKKLSRPGNSAIVPATGTYLIKSVDKGGRESRNATATIALIDAVEAGNVVQTLTENPTFSGTKSDVVVSDGALILATTLLFDSATGNFDDLDGLFDGGGSTVDNEGTYDFATVVDLGSKFTSRGHRGSKLLVLIMLIHLMMERVCLMRVKGSSMATQHRLETPTPHCRLPPQTMTHLVRLRLLTLETL